MVEFSLYLRTSPTPVSYTHLDVYKRQLKQRGKPVASFLLPGLAVSAQLGLFAMAFALLVGLPAGIVAALHHGRWQDLSLIHI